MNIRNDVQQLKTGDGDLRKFGLLVGGVFAALGVIVWLRHKAYWPYLVWPGFMLVLLGAIWPRALKYVYVAWMSVAFVLGFVMSYLILTLFFILIITPIGLVARLFGKDFLSLKLYRKAGSYWIRRERKANSPVDYERQF